MSITAIITASRTATADAAIAVFLLRTTTLSGTVPTGVVPPLGVAQRLQLRQQFLGCLPTVSGFLLEALHHELLESWRYRLPISCHGIWSQRYVRRQDLLLRCSSERRSPRQQLVCNCPDRVDVGAMVNVRVAAACSGAI